jgi:hypothetical protein
MIANTFEPEFPFWNPGCGDSIKDRVDIVNVFRRAEFVPEIVEERMPLSTSDKLGPYEILGPIGAGHGGLVQATNRNLYGTPVGAGGGLATLGNDTNIRVCYIEAPDGYR